MGNKPVYSKMTTSVKSAEASIVTAGGVAVEAAIQKVFPSALELLPPGTITALIVGLYYGAKNRIKHRKKGKA